MGKPIEGVYTQVWECEHMKFVTQKTSPVAQEMWEKNHARIESEPLGQACEPEKTDIPAEDIVELVKSDSD